jgi:hypothetical protein
MKNLRALLLVSLAWITCIQAQETFVRQIDMKDNISIDLSLPISGGPFVTPWGIGEKGANFQLYAQGTAWDKNLYLLDTKFVGTYSPAATLTFLSEDTYIRGDLPGGKYVQRTRADRPFSVVIHVAGLVPSSPSLAENSVKFSCTGCNYNPPNYTGAGLPPYGPPRYDLHESNLTNGDYTLGPLYHELTSPTRSSGCGDQTYTLTRYAAASDLLGDFDTILSQPKLEIWPVATAAVDKITPGQIFIDRIPTITLTLNHLYPDSRTYAQIYAGQAVLGTKGTLVASTERRYGRYYNPLQVDEPTNVPQDITVAMEDLSKYADADGTYTLEVITETPFFGREPERLLFISFEVDRVISSRGQLSTSEK